jgi:predicted amidohydrolase
MVSGSSVQVSGRTKEETNMTQRSRSIRVAAISVATVDGLFDSNYRRALRLAEIAAGGSPDLILLPEAFAAGYPGPDVREFGEDLGTSPWHKECRRLSAQAGVMLVVGCLETVGGGVRNAAVIYDRGERIGVHYKSSLWPDDTRPYRDERRLLVPGKGIEVFETRLGRFAILICYENMLPVNWDGVAGRVDFVLSPYNCEGDPSHNNVREAKRLGIPSAWADRTGTVYAGGPWAPNPGTAGLVDRNGHVLARSDPGVEAIVTGALPLTPS